jgi:predicted Zn-dependent protease
LNVPGLVEAVTAWGKHQPINWRDLGSKLALSMLALGLTYAKANNVHSTDAQVQVSTVQNPQIQAASIVELIKSPEVKL